MYFKQLELSGFKSFADRTFVRLEPGITGIVGPNGCGKSNILDSLRWVLGEQSAKALRGSHMQDVIFNGSENRQALGMAEVTVTFDNADSRLPVDFAEVAVTRRVYRSGESEYLINRAPVRLKDIHELFMDTGIGTNAYSLIGQGKIDLVLSSKPEDRRFLFEEAAGIIKYKTRKRVAMRKLEQAEQNLLRLNDIIQEVQRQMRSLKRQVNAAIRYRELTDLLKDLEIRAIWRKYAVLKAEVEDLRERHAVAVDAYEKAMTETSEREARSEALNLQRIEIERVLAARRDGVYQIDSEMEKIERQIALLRQQIDFSREQQQQALREQEEFSARAVAIEAQIGATQESAGRLQKEIEVCRAAIESGQDSHGDALRNLAQADERLERVRARAVESMNSRAKMQTELETLAVGIRNIDAQLEGIGERRQTQARRTEEISSLLQKTQEAEAEKRRVLEHLDEEDARVTRIHTEKAQELRAANEAWQALREQKSSLEARLRSLRELRDSYEGFATGVRAIMAATKKKTGKLEGIVGPVGDLLSTEKKFEQAIEAALGGNINNIVVEEADAAKAAIHFLKDNKAGRVTFLPLDTIRPGRDDDTKALKGLPGIVGAAIDFVSYDRRLKSAVDYLLYNTIIVETIDDAIRIARSEKRYPRLVTLDGEVVSSAGAVTGGRTQHESRGLLGRSAEIAELEQKVKQTDKEIGDCRKRGEQLAEVIEVASRELADIAAREDVARREANELHVAAARYGTELDTIEQATGHLQSQSHDLEEQRDRQEAQRRDALIRANVLDSDDAALQQSVAEAQAEAANARDGLSACAEDLADLRVQLAGLSQQLEETERNARREQRELEEALREAERRVEEGVRLRENEALLEEEIAQHIERSKALSEDKGEAQKKVVEAQNRQQKTLAETEKIAKVLRTLHDKTRESQSEVHQLEIALRHDEDQIGFFEERILGEYHVALASLEEDQVGTDEYDDETREAIVTDTREKLERMGQVNLMAIEEYETLEQRNNFLVTQEEDLRKAKETLLSVVARIDKTILDMFLTTFQQVGDSFRTYFRRLFNGGQARIYLLNEEDPLESGIEIEARPPGKKPQTISLLSGGEQAMTAIALLFSIFRAKPSPFCVLDEVDAPLDDANIGRFLAMVEEFTSESQFIIITHSKQSMARANVLYGVTMQERGVSQLVSVKFDEVRESDNAA